MSFSHDDKYLATSDLSGLVQVWACSMGTRVWNFDTSTEIEVSKNSCKNFGNLGHQFNVFDGRGVVLYKRGVVLDERDVVLNGIP